MYPFSYRYDTISTQLSPAEVIAKLHPFVASDKLHLGVAALFSKKPLLGELGSSAIRIRKRNNYQNVFQPILTADIVEWGEGSLLNCTTGVTPFAIAGAGVTVLVFIVGCCLAVAALTSLPNTVEMWNRAKIPLVMASGSILFLLAGRYSSIGESQLLIHTLLTELDADYV